MTLACLFHGSSLLLTVQLVLYSLSFPVKLAERRRTENRNHQENTATGVQRRDRTKRTFVDLCEKKDLSVTNVRALGPTLTVNKELSGFFAATYDSVTFVHRSLPPCTPIPMISLTDGAGRGELFFAMEHAYNSVNRKNQNGFNCGWVFFRFFLFICSCLIPSGVVCLGIFYLFGVIDISEEKIKNFQTNSVHNTCILQHPTDLTCRTSFKEQFFADFCPFGLQWYSLSKKKSAHRNSELH